MAKKKMAQRDVDIAQASMLVFHVPTAWDDLNSGTKHWLLDNGARVRYNVVSAGNSRFDIVINPVGRWGSAETPSSTEPANALSDYAYICKWVADDDHLQLPPEAIKICFKPSLSQNCNDRSKISLELSTSFCLYCFVVLLFVLTQQ